MTRKYWLTKRQTQCLQLLADGKDSFHAAHELGINHHTFHAHLANIREELGVSNTLQAVLKAIRLNLVAF